MTCIAPNPLFQDLKVTFQPSTLVSPSQHVERKSVYLSYADQVVNFDVKMVDFFRANSEFSPETVSNRFKLALEKVLVPYDVIAGRLRFNSKLGRREIDCNGAGVGFVMASSEYSLDEIGDLVAPNLGFRQLVAHNSDNLAPDEDQPLMGFQVTSFKCGGFAIGMTVNHLLVDGITYKTFKSNIASQAFDDNRPLTVIPTHNRRLLASRSPPHVTFPHHELYKPELSASGPSVFDRKSKQLEQRVFKFNSNDIDILMEKAKYGTSFSANAKKISSFALVAALIWRCKVMSSPNNVGDRVSTLLTAVDVRSRLNPPLPKSFCGNAVIPAYSMAACDEIKNASFGKLVELVMEAPKRLTDEYIRSRIDWMEINKGLARGDYLVSSWLGLGFERVVYPWGKPVQSVPVACNMCYLFPDANGTIDAMVPLPAEEIDKFQYHFHNFFTSKY